MGKNIFETRPTQRLCADQTVISDFSDGAMRPVPTWGLFPQEFIASSDDLLDEFLVSSLPREWYFLRHRCCDRDDDGSGSVRGVSFENVNDQGGRWDSAPICGEPTNAKSKPAKTQIFETLLKILSNYDSNAALGCNWNAARLKIVLSERKFTAKGEFAVGETLRPLLHFRIPPCCTSSSPQQGSTWCWSLPFPSGLTFLCICCRPIAFASQPTHAVGLLLSACNVIQSIVVCIMLPIITKLCLMLSAYQSKLLSVCLWLSSYCLNHLFLYPLTYWTLSAYCIFLL